MCGPVGQDIEEEFFQYGGFTPKDDIFTLDWNGITAATLQALDGGKAVVLDHYNGRLVHGDFTLAEEEFHVDTPYFGRESFPTNRIHSIELTQTPWGLETFIVLTQDGKPHQYLGTCA